MVNNHEMSAHATWDTKERMLDPIDSEILLIGNLPGEQQARLMEIADRRPIHRTLVSELQLFTRLAPVGASAIWESSTT
jgi:hypothetical protein